MTALPVRVSAPASSANLGPLFDVAGLALELRNELEVRAGSGQVTVEGEGAGQLPSDHTNLVARGTFKLADRHRATFEGVFGRSESTKTFAPNQWTSSATATTMRPVEPRCDRN